MFSYKNNKYYPHVFLDNGLYKLWIMKKCYIIIELKFLKGIHVNKTSEPRESDTGIVK